MNLYPAIDLKNGECVRLLKGEMDQATVFNDSPADQALAFQAQRADWLHVVDLNGAFEGKAVNDQAVESIIKAVDMQVQLGGGIRTLAMIEHWLALGINRVILGTVALKNPDLVKEACKQFPNRVCVGIDAKQGYVATEGWAEKSDITAKELASRFEDAGVARIIFTNIDRDGMMQGADIKATKSLAENTSIPVIISGGVSNMADIKAAKTIENSGIDGVISGRAIYEGTVDIAKSMEILRA